MPTFRSHDGIFQKHGGKQIFNASVYNDPVCLNRHLVLCDDLAGKAAGAKPTLTHYWIHCNPNVLREYTQNIDGISTRLDPSAQAPLPPNGPWQKTIELHGSLRHLVCSECREVFPMERYGPVVDEPGCPQCREEPKNLGTRSRLRFGGAAILRPRVGLYDDIWERHTFDSEPIEKVIASDLKKRPDALIVVGTGLAVDGIQKLCNLFSKEVGKVHGPRIWINPKYPPGRMKACFTQHIRGPCDEFFKCSREDLSRMRPALDDAVEGNILDSVPVNCPSASAS